MVGAKGFEPSTLMVPNHEYVIRLILNQRLTDAQFLEVAHRCLWAQTELAQKSRKPWRWVGEREPSPDHASVAKSKSPLQLAKGVLVRVKWVLGGLHHQSALVEAPLSV